MKCKFCHEEATGRHRTCATCARTVSLVQDNRHKTDEQLRKEIARLVEITDIKISVLNDIHPLTGKSLRRHI